MRPPGLLPLLLKQTRGPHHALTFLGGVGGAGGGSPGTSGEIPFIDFDKRRRWLSVPRASSAPSFIRIPPPIKRRLTGCRIIGGWRRGEEGWVVSGLQIDPEPVGGGRM